MGDSNIYNKLLKKKAYQWIYVKQKNIYRRSRSIRTMKERVRITTATLPFERCLPQLIVEMVYNCVFWLKSFPHKDSMHLQLSPRTIMRGQRITYDKHCKVEFGTYVQVHEKHNNSLEPRTSGAIALRLSRKEQKRPKTIQKRTKETITEVSERTNK